MKKMVKLVAIAAMMLTAGFAVCQEKTPTEGSDNQKVAAYLVIDGTTVIGYRDGLPAKLVIPAGVTSIGESAFEGCESLTSVVIPAGVTAIGKKAFKHCKSLMSVTIPAGVTVIDEQTFYFCTSLTSVTIPAGVTEIGRMAFEFCTSLTDVTIPESVMQIGSLAFDFCRSLTSVTIPASVTEIGRHAFADNLKEINYLGTKAQWGEIKTQTSLGDYKSRTMKEFSGIGFRGIVNCTDGAVRVN